MIPECAGCLDQDCPLSLCQAEGFAFTVIATDDIALDLSSCLMCSGFRAQQTIAVCCRSGSESLFCDLIPYLELA